LSGWSTGTPDIGRTRIRWEAQIRATRPVRPAQDVADQHDPPVRHRLLTAPWWMLSLGASVLFGLATGLLLMFVTPLLYGPATGSGTTFRFVGGIVGVAGGIVFGLVLGPVLARENQRALITLGDLPAERQREAVRAASRGPVPADPEVRSAAARLAEFQLAQTLRSRKAAVVILPLNIVAQVLLTISGSAWHWVLAAFFAVPLAVIVWQPRRLRRRIDLLQQGSVRVPDPGSGHRDWTR
jgi:hypothetical protein